MYAAVLVAFLLQAQPDLQSTAVALLGGSLQGVLCSLAECLEFYVGCGAIMARNEATLRALLADLHSLQPSPMHLQVDQARA